MDGSVRRLGDQDRVLLIRLGAVGDVLRTLPALHLIRTTFPGVRVSWIVEDLSRELLLGHPDIDEVLRFPRRELAAVAAHPLRTTRLLGALARDLRGRRFDVSLDFQGTLKSGLLSWFSGAPRRVGLSAGHARELSWLFATERVEPRPAVLNRVERNLQIADAVGARGDTIEIILPERVEEGRAAAEILGALNPTGARVVILSPGTSRLQEHKRWPLGSFSALARHLRSEDDVLPVVAWGPGEEDMARSIVAESGGAAVTAPPTTLRGLAALLRRAALFVGADTGPMHLAWGVGCPVLALFGPTDPRLNAPLGGPHAVLRSGRSTADITPAEALKAARRILGSPRAVARPPRLQRSGLVALAAEAGA